MKYKISVSDLLKQINECEEINRKTKNPHFKIGRVIIIPERGFDPFKQKHPLEDILLKKGYAYDFEGNFTGGEKTYEINLREIDIIYD